MPHNPQRSNLIRAIADKQQQEFAEGVQHGRQYVEAQTLEGFTRLRSRFDAKALRRILTNDAYPDKASEIAHVLTGHASFLVMVDDDSNVDFSRLEFLTGFVLGIEQEIK